MMGAEAVPLAEIFEPRLITRKFSPTGLMTLVPASMVSVAESVLSPPGRHPASGRWAVVDVRWVALVIVPVSRHTGLPSTVPPADWVVLPGQPSAGVSLMVNLAGVHV